MLKRYSVYAPKRRTWPVVGLERRYRDAYGPGRIMIAA